MQKKETETYLKAHRYLKQVLTPGGTVFTVLHSHSRANVIDIYAIKRNYPYRITDAVAEVLNVTYDRALEGIPVSGYGSETPNTIVGGLNHLMFPNGDALPHKAL